MRNGLFSMFRKRPIQLKMFKLPYIRYHLEKQTIFTSSIEMNVALTQLFEWFIRKDFFLEHNLSPID